MFIVQDMIAAVTATYIPKANVAYSESSVGQSNFYKTSQSMSSITQYKQEEQSYLPMANDSSQ